MEEGKWEGWGNRRTRKRTVEKKEQERKGEK